MEIIDKYFKDVERKSESIVLDSTSLICKKAIEIISSHNYIVLTRAFDPYIDATKALRTIYSEDYEAKILIDINNIVEIIDTVFCDNCNSSKATRCTLIHVKNMKSDAFYVAEYTEEIYDMIEDTKKEVLEKISNLHIKYNCYK